MSGNSEAARTLKLGVYGAAVSGDLTEGTPEVVAEYSPSRQDLPKTTSLGDPSSPTTAGTSIPAAGIPGNSTTSSTTQPIDYPKILTGGADVSALGGIAPGGPLDRAAAGLLRTEDIGGGGDEDCGGSAGGGGSGNGGKRHDHGSTEGALDTKEDTKETGRGGILPKDHHGGTNPLKAFTSKGSVGSQFNPEGSLGRIPQSIGGPFDKEGVIGKQFTSEGVIGGTVDKLLGEKNKDDPLGRK